MTVDLVIFTIVDDDLKILLIRRGNEPYQGLWALPGGFVGIGESLEEAAARGDVEEYLAANVDFHDRMVELAGNAKLLSTYRRLVNELLLFRRATLAQADALPASTREHRDIVDRIGDGKPAAAGRALFTHVMASRERMHRARTAAGAAVAPAPRTPRKSP